jgi:hypothetical protein
VESGHFPERRAQFLVHTPRHKHPLSLSLSLSLSLERGCLAKRNAEVMLILFYFPKKKTQKLFCAGVSRSSSPSTRMSWPNSTLTAYLFLKGISMLNESLQAETLNLKP